MKINPIIVLSCFMILNIDYYHIGRMSLGRPQLMMLAIMERKNLKVDDSIIKKCIFAGRFQIGKAMKVAVAQLNYTIGGFENNKIKIIDRINKAKEEGVDLVVFAEHAISGTPAYDLLNKVNFLEFSEEALVEIAAFCEGISVLVGLPIQQGPTTVSAAAFIQNRKIKHYITKRRVVRREEMGFISSGHGSEYININGHKVFVVIGDDSNYAEEYSGSADTVVIMSAQPYARARIEERYDQLTQQAFRMGANMVYANQMGAQTDIIYDGSSAIFNEKGQPVALLKSFEEDFSVIDLAKDNPVVDIPYQDKTDNVYKAIKMGLRDFFSKNGYTKACLGFSGGIDSAVVAAIAVEVLGADNLEAILMPSLFSSDHSVEDAIEMADKLGIPYHIVPITDTYNVILDAMKPVFGDDTDFGVTEENIQARIRCVMLMAYSNKYGHMLLNTSNKSELAVGYGTLYGDNTGVLSIIGDLYKGEVFSLARHINRNGEMIPENILQKEPSAELKPDQKDTDILPPYDETDAIIYRMIELMQSREEIVNAGFDKEIVYKIYGMILKNEQKRYQFCPTLRVSTCAFGKDRVMPITSKYGF